MDINTEIKKIFESPNKWALINLITSEKSVCYSILSKALYDENRNFILIDTDNFLTAIIHSIVTNRCKEFKREFCETEVLIIDADPEYLIKDSIQAELTYILCVRSYKNLPTIIISEMSLKRQKFSNISFDNFLQISGVLEM